MFELLIIRTINRAKTIFANILLPFSNPISFLFIYPKLIVIHNSSDYLNLFIEYTSKAPEVGLEPTSPEGHQLSIPYFLFIRSRG